MNKLPINFKLEKYGLSVRLVNEDDAEFIIKLRTDPKLQKFIHSTDNDIIKQKNWIQEYKKREKEGMDYYFIFLKDGVKVGLNRIYSIKDDVFTTGSWVFDPSAPIECSIASALIIRIIGFDIMGGILENGYDGCHVDNKKVLKFNKMLGLKESGIIKDVKGTYITMQLTKDDFKTTKPKIEKLIGVC